MMVGDELTEWLANARAGRDREARDLEIRRRMERERLELESEAKVTGEEEEVSKPSDDLEDGQVPLAQANGMMPPLPPYSLL